LYGATGSKKNPPEMRCGKDIQKMGLRKICMIKLLLWERFAEEQGEDGKPLLDRKSKRLAIVQTQVKNTCANWGSVLRISRILPCHFQRACVQQIVYFP